MEEGYWLGELQRQVKKNFSLFTLILVTMHYFILVKSFLLIKDYLKYIQTPPRLVLFGWSALSNEYPFICMFTSSLGIVESKKVSDRHTKSKLLLVIKASTNGTLIKSWAAKPFKFQWQNLMLDDRFGPGLVSISPDNKNRRCYRNT